MEQAAAVIDITEMGGLAIEVASVYGDVWDQGVSRPSSCLDHGISADFFRTVGRSLSLHLFPTTSASLSRPRSSVILATGVKQAATCEGRAFGTFDAETLSTVLRPLTSVSSLPFFIGAVLQRDRARA